MLKEGYLKDEDIINIRNCVPRVSTVKKMSEYFYIYSDITRLLIISALTMSELCVNELCDILGCNQTTISHQLKLLRDSNIVDYRRVGKLIYYRIVNPYVNEIMHFGIQTINVENDRCSLK